MKAVVTVFRGQEFRLVRKEPYKNKDGRLVVLDVKGSECMTCGAIYEVRVLPHYSKFPKIACSIAKRRPRDLHINRSVLMRSVSA